MNIIASARTLAALLSLGCAVGGADDHELRRDSAGVVIVESAETAWDTGDAWRVDTAPAVSIGVEEGPQHFQFSRVGGVVRLPDGRIVVGNSGSSEIRFFDSSGAFLSATGRRGQGPGEFGELSTLRILRSPSGELIVADGGNDRSNVFDDRGAFARVLRLAPAPDAPRVFLTDVFGDGTMLASAPAGGGRLDGSVPNVVLQGQFHYLRYAPNGTPLGRLFTLTTRPRWVNEYGGSRQFPFIPFTPEPLFATRGTEILVFRGPAAEIDVVDTTGRQVRRIRWPGAGARRVADVWERYTETSLETFTDEGQRQRYAHFYRQELPLPETVPAVEALLVDADGNLWARRFRLPWEAARQWDVLAADGRWLGTVETPTSLGVTQIGPDFVLGTHRDSLGVERVRLHRLQKPARP